MSDYYSLEKAAEILKLTSAEVNRLREKGEIQGYKDGSNWKFKPEVIDNYYITLTQRKPAPINPFGLAGEDDDLLSSEDEQDLPTMMADSASFAQFGDGLMSLHDSQADTVSAASDANLDDGLAVVSDDHLDELVLSDTSSQLQEPKPEEKIEIFAIQGENDFPGASSDSGSGLNLGGDSGISLIGGSGSGVDLAGSDKIFDDDDVVIGGSSSGLNLGGDSGISLLDAAAESDFSLGAAAGGSDAILELAPEDDILALIDEEVDPDTATVLGAEDDFQLLADDDTFMTDDSESSSQVIAIEGDLASEIDSFSFTDDLGKAFVAADTGGDDLLFSSDDSPAGTDSINFTEVGSGIDSAFGGFGDMDGLESTDDTTGGLGTETATVAAVAGTVVTPGSNEPKFTGLSVTALFIMVLIMAVGGSLMFELIRSIWSWSEPFTINSSILGLLGK